MRNKLIAAGAGIFGYGVLLGWAVTGDLLEAKMKRNQRLLGDIIDRKTVELDALRAQTMRDNTVKWTGDDEVTLGDVVGYALEPEADVDTSFDDNLRGETPEETRANLQEIIAEYTNPEDVAAFAETAQHAVNSGPDYTPPFVISQTMYSNDPDEGDEYAKIRWTYYPRDRVLVDDDGDLMAQNDIDHTLGWRNLDRFGDESGDVDTVFIRNRHLLSDFEVVREMDEELPIHIKFAMSREEYEANKSAGLLRFRPEDA